MRRYLTEFIGTVFLVLTIGLTGNPLAIAAVLMVMIYAGCHISGAHYNPAVSLAVLIRGRMKVSTMIVYLVSQIAGAASGAFLVGLFKGFPAEAVQTLDPTKALLAELLGTFALVYVILNVGTAKGTSGNNYFGLAIGFTVLAMATCFGSYSGGAFNPAVAVAASLMKDFEWTNFWIYLVGCFGGGILAAIVFKLNNPDDQ